MAKIFLRQQPFTANNVLKNLKKTYKYMNNWFYFCITYKDEEISIPYITINYRRNYLNELCKFFFY